MDLVVRTVPRFLNNLLRGFLRNDYKEVQDISAQNFLKLISDTVPGTPLNSSRVCYLGCSGTFRKPVPLSSFTSSRLIFGYFDVFQRKTSTPKKLADQGPLFDDNSQDSGSDDEDERVTPQNGDCSEKKLRIIIV